MVNTEILAEAAADIVALAGDRTRKYFEMAEAGRECVYGEYRMRLGVRSGSSAIYLRIFRGKDLIGSNVEGEQLAEADEDFQCLAMIADRSGFWDTSFIHFLDIAERGV